MKQVGSDRSALRLREHASKRIKVARRTFCAMSSFAPPQGAVGVKPLLKMNSIHRAPGQAPAKSRRSP